MLSLWSVCLVFVAMGCDVAGFAGLVFCWLLLGWVGGVFVDLRVVCLLWFVLRWLLVGYNLTITRGLLCLGCGVGCFTC